MCQRDGKPWPCGEVAAEALRRFIGNSPSTCKNHDTNQRIKMMIMYGNGLR